MTTTAEIAWVAGIIEGEASMEMPGPTRFPRINLAMIDLDVVIRFAEITGAQCVRTKKNRAGVKPQFHARLYGQQAIAWLMTVFVLMGERRRSQIAAILQQWRANNQKTARRGNVQRNHSAGPEIFALYKTGKDQSTIARMLNLSQPTVSQIMRGMGLRARESVWPESQQKTLVWQRLPKAGA